jgi:hypothetical protein
LRRGEDLNLLPDVRADDSRCPASVTPPSDSRFHSDFGLAEAPGNGDLNKSTVIAPTKRLPAAKTELWFKGRIGSKVSTQEA